MRAGDAAAARRHSRVLELGALIAGPFCAKILADFGADVVEIEPPGLAIRCANGAT